MKKGRRAFRAWSVFDSDFTYIWIIDLDSMYWRVRRVIMPLISPSK